MTLYQDHKPRYTGDIIRDPSAIVALNRIDPFLLKEDNCYEIYRS